MVPAHHCMTCMERRPAVPCGSGGHMRGNGTQWLEESLLITVAVKWHQHTHVQAWRADSIYFHLQGTPVHKCSPAHVHSHTVAMWGSLFLFVIPFLMALSQAKPECLQRAKSDCSHCGNTEARGRATPISFLQFSLAIALFWGGNVILSSHLTPWMAGAQSKVRPFCNAHSIPLLSLRAAGCLTYSQDS